MLVVERQHGRTAGQRADAVPAHDRQAPQDEGDDPAGTDEQEGAEPVAPIVEFHLQHGDVALNGDGQQAEHGGREGHKHTPLSGMVMVGRLIQYVNA